MVVGGQVHFSGGRRDVALAEFQRSASLPEEADLTVQAALDGTGRNAVVTVRVTAHPPARPGDDWRLLVALAQKQARTAVGHGENAGETLTEAAIARWLSPALAVPGDAGPVQLSVPVPTGVPARELELVAFVQQQSTGLVLAVRSLDLAHLPIQAKPVPKTVQ